MAGIDALQESSQKIFDEEVERVSISRSAAVACGVIGTLIFWGLMSGPIIALYSQYFSASYSSLTEMGGSLEEFPKPEFSTIATSLIVSMLPTAIFSMLVLSIAQSSSRIALAEQGIRDRHNDTIRQLQEQGVLRLQWDDPLLADAEFLLSAGAPENISA